ncbi:nucleotide-binding universal stress UspA family protein [Saccharopolyspora erythraea NRRL 2338]|uniref:Universal stress protein n=3 Tax=Saccharopolyspora erythraea TaxID=1836 RepID=A4FF36_SACEN|nr:universal stress protein [Saccharopolyspora erythraea]PFG96386.1 nucleotide-binding universal stress UspA family protein [Saccharopolyspora erythraea NRRL 2338]QRK92891.1 universal stress protein [Saccharopolyspora erythraea]CAM02661.1 putative universal stress protein [Saccharopolyspora erythraea NRRL 2338]
MADKIVVGVDGSAESKAALRWALRQAELTGSRIVAMMAWDSPPIYGWEDAPSQDLNARAAETLGDALREVAPEGTTVEIEKQVANGHPAKALLEESEDADILVLGNRGHGGFTGVLLGSVSQYCIHHATCPVMVVRAPKT